MLCRVCGHENPVGALYCEKCGAIVVGLVRPDDPKLQEAKEKIRRNVANRRRSDLIIPAWLVWIPIFLYVGSIGSTIGSIFASLPSAGSDPDIWFRSFANAYIALAIITVFYQLILAMFAYMLVKRHNEHSQREAGLKDAILGLLRSAGSSPGAQSVISRELQQLEFYGGSGTRSRPPALWALLIALPVIGAFLLFLSLVSALETSSFFSALVAGIVYNAFFGFFGFIATMYMFYFLGKEREEHERRWSGFVYSVGTLMPRMGLPAVPDNSTVRTPDRSFIVYFVLALFIPFFTFYWWYTLIKDPNVHYKEQWAFEDGLLAALSANSRFTSSASSR